MDSMLKDRLTMIAALGAGVVVGMSGIYMYYKLNRTVTQELSQLSGTIETLKREIEELKKTTITGDSVSLSSSSKRSGRNLLSISEKRALKAAKQSSPNGHHVLKNSNSNESSGDDNEEFFDFTDSGEEDESLSWATVNDPQSGSLSPSGSYNASKFSDFLDDIDGLLDGVSEEKQKAYLLLTEKEEDFKNASAFLWRFAKACHFAKLTAQKEGDLSKKKALTFKAQKAAAMALELTKDDPEVHKWYAITLGALGEYVSVPEKIKNGHTFRDHVEKAVSLKPEDPTLHHLLGRWCSEVANLSWLERKAAGMLFAEPPTATNEEAIEHFLKADKLLPSWKENTLLLSKCYINEADYSSAIMWVDKGMAAPSKAEDDELAHQELEGLQLKYRNYRN